MELSKRSVLPVEVMLLVTLVLDPEPESLLTKGAFSSIFSHINISAFILTIKCSRQNCMHELFAIPQSEVIIYTFFKNENAFYSQKKIKL